MALIDESYNTTMKKLLIILTTILTLQQFGFGQIARIAICPQLIYEEVNSYFPHDYFTEKSLDGLLDKSLEINKLNEKYLLTNVYNDGLTGHQVRIEFNDRLEIFQVDYNEWSDNVIIGSETNYTVESIIISTNQNPTETQSWALYASN